VVTDSARLRRGDILVAEATLPVWTPLFTIAAGVVTDVGGTLSHAAVTAREYGIPAVVGARNASIVLRDDQLVELDGSTGVVRLIE
jgi:pyruvate,water dikinase